MHGATPLPKPRSLLKVILLKVAPQMLSGPVSLLRSPLDNSNRMFPATSIVLGCSYGAAWPGW